MNNMLCGKTVGDGADDSGREWRKSMRSYGAGECVEIAATDGMCIAVRDSKKPEGVLLRFTPAGWRTFVADVRIGKI